MVLIHKYNRTELDSHNLQSLNIIIITSFSIQSDVHADHRNPSRLAEEYSVGHARFVSPSILYSILQTI